MPGVMIGRRPFVPGSLAIARSNPSSTGLTSLIVPASVGFVDLVTGTRATTVDAAATYGPGPAGAGRRGYAAWAIATKAAQSLPCSAVVIGSRVPTGTTQAWVQSGSSGTGWRLTFNATSGGRAVVTFGAVADYIAPVNWVVGPHGVSAAFSATGNGGTLRIYSNGAQIHSATVGTMIAPATNGLTVGANGTGEVMTEPIQLVAVWDRVLSHAEIAQIHTDPMRLLRC